MTILSQSYLNCTPAIEAYNRSHPANGSTFHCSGAAYKKSFSPGAKAGIGIAVVASTLLALTYFLRKYMSVERDAARMKNPPEGTELERRNTEDDDHPPEYNSAVVTEGRRQDGDDPVPPRTWIEPLPGYALRETAS